MPSTCGKVTPNTVNTPLATKYWPMAMAFSLIYSGAAPGHRQVGDVVAQAAGP